MSQYKTVDDFLLMLQKRDANQPEFLQAVREVFTSLCPSCSKTHAIPSRVC
ncbi:NADP-specific glutamate dehydrogenase [Leminorella richardii]|uniref:NADP-specific glutamate dehydrogenase n=1 Tax=Leminorella richardii TaxID=158841 RepID=A0A2X4UIS1_9GAMM|nr:NADP-specific glutamate dehydrogenase [Leminorella richardii]